MPLGVLQADGSMIQRYCKGLWEDRTMAMEGYVDSLNWNQGFILLQCFRMINLSFCVRMPAVVLACTRDLITFESC